ncbi:MULTISPECIES: methyl-accepting chemotaxis protein [unclassified Microcoleus]|uniref:methyl-accepting chemotaxis protein n=1 Tax=unclassified Microcoleus TaxID=2642155 RepID=UPI002FD08A48
MFRNMNLQTKLISAFLLMGLIVFVFAGVGWNGVSRLSVHINTLSDNSLPSVTGLWKINEGQTQIESSERLLFDPDMTKAERQAALTRIQNAWKQINKGFQEYEGTPRTPEEDRKYKKFQQDWDAWKKSHEKLLNIEQDYNQIGIRNPWKRQVELISQGKGNSPEIAAVKTALELRSRMDEFASSTEEPLFNTATDSILSVIAINEDIADKAKKSADQDINQTGFWVLVGMILGPVTAIILGIFLSITIAKPIDKALKSIVNMIVSSSSQIAATVEQQERIVNQQATAVNETTSTMDELGASSRQSAEQAESALDNARQVLNLAEEGATGARQVLHQAEEGATGARQVLNQAEDGNKVVEKSLEGMSELREKVATIAAQIMRLSEQTTQIGSITGSVTDLATQTNMLALNASVEAVRAGEHGKGFRVVANEIRRLADQSKKSAEKINTIITDIQNAINSTVIATDEGTKTVKEGIKLSQDTAQAFKQVTQSINDIVLKNQEMTIAAINNSVLKNQQMTLASINDIVLKTQQISLNAMQQALAVQQVVEAMNTINSGAKQTASGINQTKVGTQLLNDAAQNLKVLSAK